MKKFLLLAFAGIASALNAQTTIYSQDFEGSHGWTLNVPTGTEGADPNFFVVNDNEGGVAPGGCGVATNGNKTLHVTSVFNPAGGADYDAGGLCGLLFCPQTNRKAESPAINCTGYSNLKLSFNFISNGDGLNDNASVHYFDGSTWSQLVASVKSPVCGGGQGQWATYTVSLPASADNNANVKIAFGWVNNDDGVGTAPSLAVNDVVVSSNVPLSISLASSANLQCFGVNTGSASVTVSGGQMPYTYDWMPGTPTGDGTATVTNLSANVYTCTVQDALGASVTQTVSIMQPADIIAVSSQTSALCFGGNGSVDVSVTGGTLPGAGSPGLIISEILPDPAGTDSPFEFVELIATKNINFSVTPYTVVFSNNGTATANGWRQGTAITYAFEISTGTVSAGQVVYVGGSSMIPTTNVLRVLNTGTTAGDGGIGNSNATGVLGNGGTSADGVAVFSSSAAGLTSSTVPVDAVFYGTALGSAVVSAGTAGYQLPVNDLYSGGKLQTTSFFTNAFTAAQYLKATGAYNLATNAWDTPRTWSSTAGFTNLASSVALNGAYSYSWSNGATTQNLSNVAAGDYTLTITDANNCQKTHTVTIGQPAALATSTAVSNVLCNGGSTGSATVSVTGGTMPYTYLWSGAQTSSVVTGLNAGVKTVTVTDNNNCTAITSVSITEPSALTVAHAQTNVSCYGLCDGSATITPSGGSSPYTYVWSNGGSASPLNNLCAGDYTVNVMDASGCPATHTITITEPTAVQVAAANGTILCNGGVTSVTINATGGTGAFTGTGTFTATAGTYTYSVADANSCSTNTIITITEPAAITGAQTLTVCAGQSVTVGTSTYTATGTYTDVLTSLLNGCDSTLTTNLNVENVIDVTTSVNGLVISANANGAGYQWIDCDNGNQPIFGATSQAYTATANGNYAVIVTVGSCSDTSPCVTISTVGVKEMNGLTDVKLYPNPASSTVKVSGLTKAATIEVYNTIGELQLTLTTQSNEVSINLNNLSNGVYFVKIKSQGAESVNRIVVQR